MYAEVLFISNAKGDEIKEALNRYFSFIRSELGRSPLIFYDAIVKPDWGFFLNKTVKKLEQGIPKSFVPIFIVNDHLQYRYSTFVFKIPGKLMELYSGINLYSVPLKEEFITNYLRYVIVKKSHGGVFDDMDRFLQILADNKGVDLLNNDSYKLLRRVLVLDEKLEGHVSDIVKNIVSLIAKISTGTIVPREIDKLRVYLNNLTEAERQTIWKEAF